jgi:hypothetical protein
MAFLIFEEGCVAEGVLRSASKDIRNRGLQKYLGGGD